MQINRLKSKCKDHPESKYQVHQSKLVRGKAGEDQILKGEIAFPEAATSPLQKKCTCDSGLWMLLSQSQITTWRVGSKSLKVPGDHFSFLIAMTEHLTSTI